MSVSQKNWQCVIPIQVGVPTMWMAHPGVGKSAFAKEFAQSTGRKFIQTLISQCLPEDLGGLPYPGEINGDRVAMKMPDRDVYESRQGKVLWFWDEFSNGPHATQASGLEIINNPPRDCWLAGASNPEESSTNGQGWPPAMATRWCTVPFDADESGFLTALETPCANGSADLVFDSMKRLPIVGPNWWKLHAYWKSVLHGMLGMNPELLQQFPDDAIDQGKAFPTKRTWSRCLKALAACDDVCANGEVQLQVATGCVGEIAAIALMRHAEDMDIPDPAEVLADKTWKVPQEAGKAMAIFRSVRSLILQRINGAVTVASAGIWWERWMEFSLRVWKQRQEYGMLLNSYACNDKPAGYKPQDRSDDPNWKAMCDLRLGNYS